MKRLLAGVLALVLVACQAKFTPATTDGRFTELVGHWDNGDGCQLEIANQHNQLKLISYTAPGRRLNDLPLTAWKEGIMSKFKAKQSEVQFSGLYSEGLLLIDHDCRSALHKDDS